MLSKEEKEAIEILKKLQKKTPYIIWGDETPYNKSNQIQTILNLMEKLQKEIEEKSTIIMAGTEKVKQLEKEIILLKIEKLRAIKQYKECHLSQTPDTSNIYYSIKLELEAIDEEISNLMRIWEKY